jgi:hypothetical protein
LGAWIKVSQRHTVSASYSIFQKPCPACASSVSVGAERCHCGHVFESSAKGQSPQEAALRDEELYEAYLTARAQQARQAAHVAEQAQTETPDDTERVSAAELASEVANSIEADLVAQHAKISALRQALPAAPPQPVTQFVMPEIAPLDQPVAISIAAVHPTQSAPVSPAKAASTTPAVWHTATTAQKAAGVLAALKSAKAREAVARAHQAMAVTPQPAATANTAARSVPPQTFRQDQASRADKIMEARKTPDAKDCPNCTASVPLNTTRCHCGFAFVSGSSDLPSLTLCTGDFTALRDSLKLGLR